MNTAIVIAAGQSRRMNSRVNKLLMLLEERPVIEHTLEVFDKSKDVDSIILVANEEIKSGIGISKFKKIKNVVSGGAERQDSVYNGLLAINNAKDDDIVIIHNGANPLVSEETISKTVQEAKAHGASVSAFRVKDTIKIINNGFVKETLNRESLWAMQTPQCIRYGIAKEAFEKAKKDGFYATDDAALVERIGKKVKIIESNPENIKITDQTDLAVMHGMKSGFLVGLGQDSHRFSDKEKKLVLGGHILPDEQGLEANSDGDVILHALFNAVSQALGKRSLGHYADPLCGKGITDSKEYMKIILGIMEKEKYKINNIGIMLECKRPKIDIHADKIIEAMGRLLNIKKEQIGITATSGEGLTEFGQGKGMQCFAIVSLKK